MQSKQNIIIAGHGAYGTALGQVLTENGHSVTYYDPFYGDTTPPTAFNDAQIIVIAVPSEYLLDFLPILDSNYNNQPVILATKGVINLSDFTDKLDQLSILSGPGFAVDIVNHQPTTLTATTDLVKQLFSTDYLTIELTDDRAGVLACGALKNIYAIGAGLRQIRPDSEQFAVYIEQSLSEIKLLIPHFDGRPETADLSCGIGDLILTCSSTKSRNYSFGYELATNPNYKPTQTTEGITSLHSLPGSIDPPPILADIKKQVITDIN